VKKYSIGIADLGESFVIGFAALKQYNPQGKLRSKVYGLFLGSYGIGWAVNV
jgi:hypothetical protein